tara:strand:- start:13028 stop:15034 length:2007 start_codon:yes stop_codon:yes gene_type:complete
MDKKFLLSIFVVAIFLFAIFPVMVVASDIINITIKGAAANGTNHSGSGNSYNNTFFVTCGSNLGNITNMTIAYNISTTTEGDSGTGAAAPLGTTGIVVTAANTTANQTFFNTTIDISGFTASATYGFWCYPHNVSHYIHADLPNSSATANVTIDNTAPSIKILNATVNAVHQYENTTNKSSNTQLLGLNVSISDSVWLQDGALCFFNTNTTNQSVTISKVNSTWGYCNSSRLNLTNLVDGNHQIKIYINDSYGNGLLNDTKWFQLDSTAPVVVIHTSYSNNTAKKNTDLLTLNISVIDAFNGLPDSAFCFFDINLTNQTVSLEKNTGSSTNGWCNSSHINLSTMPDGINYTNVYINDSLNNMRWNKTISVLIDTTVPPSPTASCTETSVTLGSNFPCTCSGTDATSGINDTLTTAGTTITSPTAGSFTYSCSVTDNAGNSASSTFAYTVLAAGASSSSSSSSGGGGSSATPSSVKSNTFTTVTPEKVSIMKNFDEKVAVEEIKIEVSSETENVKVTVSKYDNKPTAVSVEKTGKTYQYMEIKTENVEDSLRKATVTIKVEKSWLSDNSIEKENVVLSKFDETSEQWNELTTTYKNSDETYEYFDAELTSFSYFAISEKVVEEVVEEDKGIGTILGEKISEEAKSLGWLWVVIVLLVALAVYVIFNRKK